MKDGGHLEDVRIDGVQNLEWLQDQPPMRAMRRKVRQVR
jgi:hypothetical protein